MSKISAVLINDGNCIRSRTPPYMVILKTLHSSQINYIKRSFYNGQCTSSNQYTTSPAWCHSCDPIRVSQVSANGNKDIGEISKDFYLKPLDMISTDYGECMDCKRPNTSKAWCQSCDLIKISKGWTSGNKDIDSSTEYDKVIEWIPFYRLSNIKKIGEGGFGDVFSATWSDGKRRTIYDREIYIQSRPKSIMVALKTLSSSQTSSADFLREYANNGNLRHYLSSNFKKLIWKDKLLRLIDISKDLIKIHEARYIHCDFHSGNIMKHQEGLWLEKIIKSYIADLGLSQNNKESTLEKGIYGFWSCYGRNTTRIPPFDGYLIIDEIDTFEESDDELDEKFEINNKFSEADDTIEQLPKTEQKNLYSVYSVYTSQFVDVDKISQRFSEEVKSDNIEVNITYV
ncbi:hypothetical protein C2G38_2172693 [Gigaspora rosea]|uniref:Protein kinase domain-containing protein n=1 Tax=Gigaspora rosea TaxID=44941 RepID=A0A397VKD4_9GLOM|nr:hypothetical protein C2G38_2172693 [Gigaspora rosea]